MNTKKRKRKRRRGLGILLAAALLLNMTSFVYAAETGGLTLWIGSTQMETGYYTVAGGAVTKAETPPAAGPWLEYAGDSARGTLTVHGAVTLSASATNYILMVNNGTLTVRGESGDSLTLEGGKFRAIISTNGEVRFDRGMDLTINTGGFPATDGFITEPTYSGNITVIGTGIGPVVLGDLIIQGANNVMVKSSNSGSSLIGRNVVISATGSVVLENKGYEAAGEELTIQKAGSVTISGGGQTSVAGGKIDITSSGDVAINQTGGWSITQKPLEINSTKGSVTLSGGGETLKKPALPEDIIKDSSVKAAGNIAITDHCESHPDYLQMKEFESAGGTVTVNGEGLTAEAATASVTINGKTTYYNNIVSAWNAAQGKTSTSGGASNGEKAVLRIHKDVNMGAVIANPDSPNNDYKNVLLMESGDVTLEMDSGVRLYNDKDGNPIIHVSGGTFTMKSGTISAGEQPQPATAVLVKGGTVNIEGGTVKGSNGGLSVYDDGKVNLTGGTFSGGGDYAIENDNGQVGDLLGNGYAYWQVTDGKDGDWVRDTTGKRLGGLDPATKKLTEITVKPNPMAFTNHPDGMEITYGETPELSVEAKITDSSAFTGSTITYQWYQVTETGSQEIPGAAGTSYKPAGRLAAGTYEYYCRATCEWFSLNSDTAEVTVEKKELTPSIVWDKGAAPITKVYDGTTEAPAGLSVEVTGVLSGDQVTVSAGTYAYNSANVAEAGTITASGIVLGGDGKENYALTDDTAEIPGTITQSQPTLRIEPAYQPDKAYDGKALDNPKEAELEVSGAAYGDVDFTWKTKDGALVDGTPVHAGVYILTAKIPETDNCKAAEAVREVVISRGTGALTIPETSFRKTFGDPEFSLDCEVLGDGKLSYKSDNEKVAAVSADGKVAVRGVGTAVISVTLSEGRDYAEDTKTVTVSVAKAAAPVLETETRNYNYMSGSRGPVTADAAGKLPADRGETVYTCTETTDPAGILSEVSVDGNGILTYTVAGNKAVGDKASVTVKAEMANYEDAEYTLEIELVVKKAVELKEGSSVSVKEGSTLTYGQPLSELPFGPAIFVEEGTDIEVDGILSWKDGETVPGTGTAAAEWVFTPSLSEEYLGLTGMAQVTVEKADPEVETPTVDGVIYHPSVTLGSLVLKTEASRAASVEGMWSWKDETIVPEAGDHSYAAVFTPKDTVNYNTVEREVAVSVAKAEPYIAVPPAASGIRYGDRLEDAVLTGGAARYSDGDETVVAGSFVWKDGTIKPAVADSGVTEYTVVFLPADGNNYHSVEAEVTLTVEPSEYAPDMPSENMNVPNRCEKVEDVGLPEGWQWKEEDKDTALEVGVPKTVTAVYTGADRDNYRYVTKKVTITRSECDHEWHSVVTKAPTNTEKGVMTYTCSLCGDSYMESIPALGGASQKPGTGTEGTKPVTGTKPQVGKSPETGEPWRPWQIMVVTALAVMTGNGIILGAKRKKDSRK